MRSMKLEAGGRQIYFSSFDEKTGATVRSVDAPMDRWNTPWDRDTAFKAKYKQRTFGGVFSPTPETVDVCITDKCGFGCEYCLTPETPVLGADLIWRPISSIEPGDVLTGFEESAQGRLHRKLKPTVVQGVRVTQKDVLRIITDTREILTTGNHGWLQHRANHGHRWRSADQLRVGLSLSFFNDPFTALEPTNDYRLGYLSAMTLGDGTFRFEPGWKGWNHGFPQAYWRIALVDEEALGRVVAYLSSFGVASQIRPFDSGSALSKQRMQKVEIRSIPKLEIIHSLVKASVDSSEYKRGFLAGFFDAEGSHDGNLRYSQKDVSVLERVARYGAALGFTFKVEQPSPSSTCSNVRLVGSVHERMRFLGTIRPAISRKTTDWVEGALEVKADTIRAIEKMGKRDVVDIQTSSATFFAGGLATHNCYMDSQAKLDHAPKDLTETIIAGFDVPPYQMAIGGGEPTLHPDFPEILRRVREMGTVPNYTTNGEKLNRDIVQATNEVCGGVAMTFHAFKGIEWFVEHYRALRTALKVQINVHVIADKDVAKNLLALAREIPTLGPVRVVLLAFYPDVGRATLDGLITKRVYMRDLPDAIKVARAAGIDFAFSEGLLPYFLSRPELGINTTFAMRSEGLFSCYVDSRGRMSTSSFDPPTDQSTRPTIYETSSQEIWNKLYSWKGQPLGNECHECQFEHRCATPHEFHYLICGFAGHNRTPLLDESKGP